MQQRGLGAASEAVQNPPAAAANQKGGVAYTDQDRKILQLCGEDPAGAGPRGPTGSNLEGTGLWGGARPEWGTGVASGREVYGPGRQVEHPWGSR